MVLEGQHYKRLCQGRRTFSWPHPPAKEKYQPVSLHSKQVGGCGKERQVVQLFRTPPREYWPSRVAGEWGGRSCPPCPLTLAPLGCSGLEEAFKAAPNPS